MNKSAFVTGAGGFIGSHLAQSLLREGWRVRALVHYNSRNRIGWLSEDKRIAEDGFLDIVAGDIRDPFQMRQAIEGCSVVFHLAALIGIPYSYAAPMSYVETNIAGTVNLLEAARLSCVERFVHTSTSETYGTARYTPIDENHPLQGQSPYSASKIAADKLVESYYRSFELPVVTVRPFNTYGPRQSARAIIPTIISQALRGREVRIGSLAPIRDMTFVTDTTAGFIAAAVAGDHVLGNVYNLGTGDGFTVKEIAQSILELLGGDYQIIQDKQRVRPDKSEVMALISDNRLSGEQLNWRPTVKLADGLQRTIDWIRSHLSEYEIGDYTV